MRAVVQAAALVVAVASAHGASGPNEVQIVPYMGYGRAGRFVASGRVLKARALNEAEGKWGRLVNNIKRLHSAEVANVPIRVQIGPAAAKGKTDDEGYYRVVVTCPVAPNASDGIVAGTVTVAPGAKHRAAPARVQFVVPTPATRFGVISDIDDTVLVSHCLDKAKLLVTATFGDADTRRAFPGTSAFYRGLSAGRTGREHNCIFYVSGSPWNIYDVLTAAFARLDMPPGPLFLRDFGLGKDADPLFDIRRYKRSRIEPLLDFFPDMKFLLIGDSGQSDPELYWEVATDARYRDRILGVYIRDVNEPKDADRRQELRVLAKRVGTGFFVFNHTADAAARAGRDGLIAPNTAAAIHRDAALTGSLWPGSGTRCPIVLAHGLLGFGKIGIEGFSVMTYFHGIPEHLGEHGYRSWVTEVGKTDGVALRAQHLKTNIDRLTSGKVNIVAHSMGGLDARYMITHLGMADRVASLTTIGTPHRGTAFADWGTDHLGGGAPLLEALGMGTDAFFDLTTAACLRFNQTTPNVPGVRYFSYSGTQPRRRVFATLHVSHIIIERREGANDGLVSQKSAQWGEYLGNLDADHLNLIGWKFPWEHFEKFDAKRFYLDLARSLRDKGL